jgi:hypothetical protein
MDLSGIFQFVSAAKPGSTHDIELLRQVKEELESGLDDRDVVVLDKGYQGFDREVSKETWLVKKKRSRNSELSKEDENYNAKIESIRRRIEMRFGSIKSTFECLLRPWRHDRAWLSPVARFCFAVMNSKLRNELNPNQYNVLWEHSIPKIENPRKRKKQVRLVFHHFSFAH